MTNQMDRLVVMDRGDCYYRPDTYLLTDKGRKQIKGLGPILRRFLTPNIHVVASPDNATMQSVEVLLEELAAREGTRRVTVSTARELQCYGHDAYNRQGSLTLATSAIREASTRADSVIVMTHGELVNGIPWRFMRYSLCRPNDIPHVSAGEAVMIRVKKAQAELLVPKLFF